MSSALSVLPLLKKNTGVSPTPSRRRFTAAYKQQILAAADLCTVPGDLGALLRREGLYSSNLSVWRAALRRGELQGPTKRRETHASGSSRQTHCITLARAGQSAGTSGACGTHY